jgi:VWFA-related protein
MRLRSHRPSLAIVLPILAASTTLTPDARQETISRTAYVTVLDDSNAPVTGLTAADITIVEDGTPRPVTAVAPATDPLAIALLVDTAQPPPGMVAPIRDIRAALNTFVGIIQAANPESQMAIMETGGAAVLTVRFTSRTQDLTRGINRLIQTQRAATVVLEGLQEISRVIAQQPILRRAILSVDFDQQETSRINDKEFSSAVQRAGASVWSVSIRSPAGSAANREAVLEWLAGMTGGLRLTGVVTSALESQLRTVASALTSQYLVTYQRPNGVAVAELRAAATRGARVLAVRPAVK